jgi:putative photosynthetic complex assembly protein
MDQTMSRPDPQRRPAMACGALIAVAIGLVAFGRTDRVPSVDEAAAVERLALKFDDLSDGTVVALNADGGQELARIHPGEGGFVRVTMRSFAAERISNGFGREEPFELLRMPDGDLILSDRVTGRTMLLNAFGPANEGAFAQLMDKGRMSK